MLPIRWNGSNGAIHFGITAARKSFTVCACTAPATSTSAQNAAAVNFFIGFLPLLFLEHALMRVWLVAESYVMAVPADNGLPAGILLRAEWNSCSESSPRTRGPIRRVLSVSH